MDGCEAWHGSVPNGRGGQGGQSVQPVLESAQMTMTPDGLPNPHNHPLPDDWADWSLEEKLDYLEPAVKPILEAGEVLVIFGGGDEA